MVILVPMNAIARTQVLSGMPRGCGWSLDVVLAFDFFSYWFDSHSSMIPFSRSLLDIDFEFANWSILIPVVRYMAFANSLFPPWMRSMKASRRVCIHPHSVVVSSSCLLGGVSLLNFGLNSCRVSHSFLYFAKVWRCVSDRFGILLRTSLECMVNLV